MSTTAVGPAMLAALICGQPVLRKNEATLHQDASMTLSQSKLTNVATEPVDASKHPDPAEDVRLPDLLDRASRSARRCLCEGSASIARKPIQQCIDCHHTTCTTCGGNPTHNYHVINSVKRISPVEFESYLRSRLPQSLSFKDQLMSDSPISSTDQSFASAALAAVRSTFTFSRVQRTHIWTAVYIASAARLELKLDGQQASWQLFALPSKALPVNSELRELLEQPVATVMCNTSLLDGQWLWRPSSNRSASLIYVRGIGQRIASWLARLELPDYRDQHIWSRLDI